VDSDLSVRIATDLRLSPRAVAAVIALLVDGSTVPFIARYRKEATEGMDEVRIRDVAERRAYLVELAQRRETVLSSIQEQGLLDGELRARIEAVKTKTELEDLYAPFKPKRRTRATIAKERGLLPLAEAMWRQPRDEQPQRLAASFVSPQAGVPDVDTALAGARDICAERIADDPRARSQVREVLARHGRFRARKVKDKRNERTKFDDHVGRDEAYGRIATHRYLALCRGEADKVLRLSLVLEDTGQLLSFLERRAGVHGGSPWAKQLREAVADGVKRLMLPRAESELRGELKARADREAVEVFARNLRDLLLGAPFGERPVVAIDPGQRTGCKCAALDATGRLVSHDTMFLVQGEREEAKARHTLRRLLEQVDAVAVAVGNGTHGRETATFVREALADSSAIPVVLVNEAGASVYSASDVARRELGDVDVVVRGAVSIGRRLQDPLAELVKIDPASIGVGQYQHDVPPALLASKLDDVVEDCVSSVGVALNNASASLLARVAGLGAKQARAIVAHREKKGRFTSRRKLLEVSGIGAKSFEQAAGFLRIRDGKQALDASAVHPERYPLVQAMARDLGLVVGDLVGNADAVQQLDRSRYLDGDVGAFTLDDILAELVKPGRDPRARFEAPAFRDDVRRLEDLHDGMVLEGVVTNVTNFGAFVDVGVKQDGLVHISQIADRFVKHPSDVVSVGAKLTVRVLSVDHQRKRISLSAKGL
jgi:protein Tex